MNEKTWREEEKLVSPLETDGYTACCGDVIPMVQSPLQSWWDKDCDTRMKPAREPERFLGKAFGKAMAKFIFCSL